MPLYLFYPLDFGTWNLRFQKISPLLVYKIMPRIIIWFVLLFGGAFLGFYLNSIWFQKIHQSILFHSLSAVIGFLLLAIVMRISKNTGRTLAKYGRKGNLKRMETNVIVKDGVYRYMRHPMHLGLLFFPLSIAFITGSPSFILFIAPSEMGFGIFSP